MLGKMGGKKKKTLTSSNMDAFRCNSDKCALGRSERPGQEQVVMEKMYGIYVVTKNGQ